METSIWCAQLESLLFFLSEHVFDDINVKNTGEIYDSQIKELKREVVKDCVCVFMDVIFEIIDWGLIGVLQVVLITRSLFMVLNFGGVFVYAYLYVRYRVSKRAISKRQAVWEMIYAVLSIYAVAISIYLAILAIYVFLALCVIYFALNIAFGRSVCNR